MHCSAKGCVRNWRWWITTWTWRNRNRFDGLVTHAMGEPVPGVVISADGRPETVAQVHAAGLDYLAKPVKPAALRALLSRHLPL
jgi:CheY-like chemotaxis protein